MGGLGVKKIVGHMHFEGSVPINFLVRIAHKNSLNKHATIWEAYRPRYFSAFSEFSKYIILSAQTLRTRSDFYQAGLLIGEQLHNDDVIYAEIIWVPQLYFAHTIGIDDILDALNEARYITFKNKGIEMNWIVDLVRGYPRQGEKVIRWLQGFSPRSRNVVGVGLGGNETHPLNDMKDLLLSVRDFGIEVYPHSGEQCGAEQVEEVVSVLGPPRLAHGIRATEEKATLDIIHEQGIHLDICPVSNIALRVYDSLQNIPIVKLVDADCAFSINTDDPALFGTNLKFEIEQCMAVHGLTADFVRESYRKASNATFLLPQDKVLLSQRLL